MVVNAMMVSMAAHPEEQSHIIYHVTSSVRNPAPYSVLAESGHQYFFDNPPCTGRNGERVQLNKMRFFSTVERLRLHMAIKYKLPLEVSYHSNMGALVLQMRSEQD
jgi:fatty acyl-CoA reductase